MTYWYSVVLYEQTYLNRLPFPFSTQQEALAAQHTVGAKILQRLEDENRRLTQDLVDAQAR